MSTVVVSAEAGDPRSQLWQWTHQATQLVDGTTVDRDFVLGIVEDECEWLRVALSGDEAAVKQLESAQQLFERVSLDDDFVDFLTLPAYEQYVD